MVLSNNNFSGHFDWLSLFNLTELFLLKINHNQFSRAMSNELPNWVFLVLLDVSNNMSGKIPTWICNQTSVSPLFLRDNYFEDQIPCGKFDFFLGPFS